MIVVKLWKSIRYRVSSLFGEKARKSITALVARLLTTGRQGIDLNYVEMPKADVVLKLAQATDILIKSLDRVDKGVVQAGSLLVVKVTRNGKSYVAAGSISGEIQRKLEQDPQLILNPESLFSLLSAQDSDEMDDEDCVA